MDDSEKAPLNGKNFKLTKEGQDGKISIDGESLTLKRAKTAVLGFGLFAMVSW